MRHRLVLALVPFALAAIAATAAEGPSLRLARVYSDHAVLQRGVPLPVRGWAEPGAEVTATLGAQKRTATAGADGAWTLAFAPLEASDQPIELRVASGAAEVLAQDLLVGEVWICGGQSNMEMWLDWARDGHEEVAAATFPAIRLMGVPPSSLGAPATDVNASWVACAPPTARGFSAVGYFFGRELHRRLAVPIGLISSNWGGTPAESWLSKEALAAEPTLAYFADRVEKTMADLPVLQERYRAMLAEWEKQTAAASEGEKGWETAALDDTAWKDMPLPSHWEDHGENVDGVVWFRRRIELPATLAGHDLRLSLGPIDDQDVTWWDGEKVGETGSWDAPRIYPVPARLATAGAHVIAIRVTDLGGPGGVYGKPEQLVLDSGADGGASVGLAGAWKYRLGPAVMPKPAQPDGPGNAWFPASLRNAMITPLLPYPIRGAIWYQGESNAGRAWQYRTLLPALIADWRAAWGQPEMPFLFVQLPNINAAPAQPGESAWAELRDAQLFTLRTVPHAGMACAIDLGEARNLHPANKQDVGLRLARWALADTYGVALEPSGPLYREAAVEGDAIRIRFDHLGGGLVARGDVLVGFAIAGEDRAWHWADAAIEGDSVMVRSAEVPKPLAVRYAWADNPEGCSLGNQAGLPASPFRTDDWPAITRDAR